GGPAFACRAPRGGEERVTRLPLPDLLRRPVTLGIALVVAVPAVGGGLHDRGALAGAGRQDHVLHGRRRRRHVVAVDSHVAPAVARRPLGQPGAVAGGRGE